MFLCVRARKEGESRRKFIQGWNEQQKCACVCVAMYRRLSLCTSGMDLENLAWVCIRVCVCVCEVSILGEQLLVEAGGAQTTPTQICSR